MPRITPVTMPAMMATCIDPAGMMPKTPETMAMAAVTEATEAIEPTEMSRRARDDDHRLADGQQAHDDDALGQAVHEVLPGQEQRRPARAARRLPDDDADDDDQRDDERQVVDADEADGAAPDRRLPARSATGSAGAGEAAWRGSGRPCRIAHCTLWMMVLSGADAAGGSGGSGGMRPGSSAVRCSAMARSSTCSSVVPRRAAPR